MGRSFYVFLKLVNLILCIFLIVAWIMFSNTGIKAFSDKVVIYDDELLLFYQLGFILMIAAIFPIFVTILIRERQNKVLFFGLTLVNIFLLFLIVMLFTVSYDY